MQQNKKLKLRLKIECLKNKNINGAFNESGEGEKGKITARSKFDKLIRESAV